MSVYTTRINVSMPRDFLKAVNQAARWQGMDRSTFIRIALKEKMGLKNFRQLDPYVPSTQVTVRHDVMQYDQDYEEEFREDLESFNTHPVE